MRRSFPRGAPNPRRRSARDDDRFAYVAAWEWNGVGTPPTLHREPLEFEEVHRAAELQVKHSGEAIACMTIKLRVWRQAGTRAPGRLVDYGDGVAPDMSFLEMLDVVNEGLMQGRRADRVRLRLPRRHLRLVRLMIDGIAHGPTAAPPRVSCSCATSRTATRSRSSPGAQGVSRS